MHGRDGSPPQKYKSPDAHVHDETCSVSPKKMVLTTPIYQARRKDHTRKIDKTMAYKVL
jgi:hypothetical protein